jgi:uncharacterized protein (TIGR02284 family)
MVGHPRKPGMKNDEVLSLLKDLIQTLEDGREGFEKAAESSEDPDVARVLIGFSEQRAQLSAQLQTLGSTYGDSAYDQGGSVVGAMHRGWINLKAALASRNAFAILSECERGEDHAVSEFRKALEMELPSNVREVVESQSAAIEVAHDRVKELRDLAKAAGE